MKKIIAFLMGGLFWCIGCWYYDKYLLQFQWDFSFVMLYGFVIGTIQMLIYEKIQE